jgi:hypothetical protein
MSTALFVVQCFNGLQLGVLLFLVAAGLTLVFGVMDFINLAHGVQYMLGAYLAVAFYRLTGNFFAAVALALPASLLAGLVLEVAVFRHLYQRDHLEQVLATFGGAPIDHRGSFYTVTMPPFPGAGPAPVPIYLAAVNPLMASTAGRVADGVLGHPMTSPAYVREVLRPAVARGASEAGRDPGEVSVSTGVILQISEDAEQARLEAAYQVGFYATTRTYRPVLAMHGYEGLVEPLRAALAAGDLAALARIALPMVDDLAIAGTPEQCRAKVAASGTGTAAR